MGFACAGSTDGNVRTPTKTQGSGPLLTSGPDPRRLEWPRG